MSRYIDADALGIGRANQEIFNNKAYADGWNKAVDIIVSTPTADVQEVRHGRWSNFLCYNTCSRCGRYVHEYDDDAKIQDFAFCPYCGAKMDENDDNERGT